MYRSPLLQRQAQELVQNPIPKTRKLAKNLIPQIETGPNKYQNTQELILQSNPTKTKPSHPQRMASSVATNQQSPKLKTESHKPTPQPYTNTNNQRRRNPHGTRGTRLTHGAGAHKGQISDDENREGRRRNLWRAETRPRSKRRDPRRRGQTEKGAGLGWSIEMRERNGVEMRETKRVLRWDLRKGETWSWDEREMRWI